MLNLRATNNQLIIGAKYSFLADNYSSGVTDITVDNISGFSDADYLLIGNFGSETAEIVQINGNPSGSTITLVSATKFAHAESTKITIISYNQVKFYHTTTATFSDTNLLSTIDIQADNLYTIYTDSVNSSGFGWFKFYNSATTAVSQNSNAIPYADFDKNSTKKILDGFYSLLNNKERKIITSEDSLRWLNEGYARTINELNLVSNTYNVSTETEISVVADTKEYDLNDSFSDIISVYNSTDDLIIDYIDIEDIPENDADGSNEIKYYLRGDHTIGFSPTPTTAFTVKVRYKSNSTQITSIYDNIVLPENNYSILIDYMLFKAKQKLKDPTYMDNYKIFTDNIQTMKLTSHKRNNSKDSWGVADEANI